MKLIDMEYWLQQWQCSTKPAEVLPLLMRRIGHAYSLRHKGRHAAFFRNRCRDDIATLRHILRKVRDEQSPR